MSKQIKLTPDPDKQLRSIQLADAIKQQKQLDKLIKDLKKWN